MAVGGEENNIKREGEAISSSIQCLGCQEEYQVGKGEKRRQVWGRKSRFKINWGREGYKVAGNFIHPCNSPNTLLYLFPSDFALLSLKLV